MTDRHDPHYPAVRALLGALLAACAIQLLPVQLRGQESKTESQIVWPPPPEAARISYVGPVSSDKDLGKKHSFLGRLTRALAGSRENRTWLTRPTDVYAMDSTRVFVSDGAMGKVLVLDFHRKRVTVLGESGPGALTKPMGLGGDDLGRVYVTDQMTHRVVVFDTSGAYITAYGGASKLLNPVDVAVDTRNGRIYVADSYQHQVVVFNLDGELIQRIGKNVGSIDEKLREGPNFDKMGSHGKGTAQGPRDIVRNRGSGDGEFLYPLSVAVSSKGTLFVSDGLNARIQVFDSAGNFLRTIGRMGDTPGSFARPKGLSLDSKGHLYVVDAAFNNVQVFDRDGNLLISFAGIGTGPGQLWLPLGIHVDRNDRIYVADRYNNRLQIFQYLDVVDEPPVAEARGR